MLRLMALLYHCYERSEEGALHCPLTGQRLNLLRRSDDVALFEYGDPEMVLPVTVAFLPSGAPPGERGAVVDWNQPQHGRVRADYGLWRRLTWFLLDALLAWSDESGESPKGVTVTGAWLDGRWYADARCESVLIRGGKHRDRLIEGIAPFKPYPLGVTPPSWRYEKGKGGAREGRIATVDENDRCFVADLRTPVAEQLADVPRFVSGGDIFFFHKVAPHVGPEYAPAMDYGMSVGDFAFYFSGRHADPRGKPIKLDPKADARDAMVWQEGYALFSDKAPPPPRVRLHPRLREKLYFALGEVNAIRVKLPEAEWPVMADLEVGQEMRFGSELWHISQPPMSVGLPFCQLSFWFGHEWRRRFGAQC